MQSIQVYIFDLNVLQKSNSLPKKRVELFNDDEGGIIHRFRGDFLFYSRDNCTLSLNKKLWEVYDEFIPSFSV